MALEELAAAVAHVADAVGDRVVGIGPGWTLGSGVVVETGRILTNAHHVRAAEVTVVLADGRAITAGLLAGDADGDLAVLEADTGEVTALSYAEESAGLGTPVVALANPGGRALRATLGLVSGVDRAFRGPRGRRVTGALEHTAPMARGSSGGPLLDTEGRLLGVNTHRLGDGFYLARPADERLRARVADLARGVAPPRLWLGVALVPDRAARRIRAAAGLPDRDGVLVHDVEADGPADRAGLRRGDLVVAAGGRDIARVDDLHDVLAGHAPDAPLPLRVVRGTDEVELEVAPHGG